jgi:hypothetical protein
MERAKIEVSRPRKFGLAGVLAAHVMSFLLAVPLLIALLLVSAKDLGIFNLLIPVAALVAVVCVLPFFGNACISLIVRNLRPSSSRADSTWVVQITLCPRIRKGIRAALEDADDVGYLALEESALIFNGDSVRMTIPFERIREVQGENVGLRGAYLTSGRIILEAAGLDGFEGVEIAERSSRLIFSSRKITREVFARIKEKVDASQ